MLQTGSSHKLFLRKAFAGAHPREQELHREFAEHRIRGEWFHPAVLDHALPETLIDLTPKKKLPARRRGGRGRPRLPNAKRIFLTIRYSDVELEALRAEAEARGIGLRPLARKKTLRGLKVDPA